MATPAGRGYEVRECRKQSLPDGCHSERSAKRRVAPIPVIFPNFDEGAPGPSLLGTGDGFLAACRSLGGSLAHTTLPPAVASASYNADNQLTQWGGTAMTYDPNGNLTSDGAHTYTWSPRNLLASIDGGNTASFVYGPFGRRVSKTVYGTTSGYLYDGPNVVQELSGSTPSANLLSGGWPTQALLLEWGTGVICLGGWPRSE